MPSLLPGYEYDIFISYRQNDNRSGWVTAFVESLREELASTIKEPVSVYFDTSQYDGLRETHIVTKSIANRLKCLLFVPVISHTYCDPSSFAWRNEFLPFLEGAKEDEFGLEIRLRDGNVTSRVLPVQIHELSRQDYKLFETAHGDRLRSIPFVFSSLGVNRPLGHSDVRSENLNRTVYRDQVNKLANAIDEIIESMRNADRPAASPEGDMETISPSPRQRMWTELTRRNVARAALTYLIVALLLHQFLIALVPILQIEQRFVEMSGWVLLTGFPLACLLAWFYEVSPHGIIRTSSRESTLNPYPSHKKKPLTSRSVVAVLTGALICQYVYFNYIKESVSDSATDQFGNRMVTIAVLPFENRSGDSKDKYIADGITDDIINRLSIISGLKVTNRSNIQSFQGKLVSYDDIAKDLDVMTLLVGSVQRSTDEIVVRAQLIDGKTNSFIWGNTYQRTAENIMAVQSEIAEVIAERLEIQLNDLEKARLNLPPTENPTAYDYYLRGRSHYYRYDKVANDSAIHLFKKAIDQDPDYALAWAGLGDAYSQMNARFGLSDSWLDSSLVASERAIRIDSNLSDAYKAYANAYSYKKQYDKAFPFLQKAVELNPTNERAIGNLGTNYFLRADLPNALRWEKKAVGMDPKNGIPYQIIGWIYRMLGDLDQAESWLLKSLELRPDLWDTYEHLAYTYVADARADEALKLVPRVLSIGSNEARPLEVAGLISHYAGDSENARIYFQRSIDNNPSYADDPNTLCPVGLGQLLLHAGDRVEAEVYLSHALDVYRAEIDKGSQFTEYPFYVAAIYAVKGQRQQSLEWLDKAIAAGWMDYAHILYGPYFSAYRTDEAILSRTAILQERVDSMRRQTGEY